MSLEVSMVCNTLLLIFFFQVEIGVGREEEN